jgi:hypothetical protein
MSEHQIPLLRDKKDNEFLSFESVQSTHHRKLPGGRVIKKDHVSVADSQRIVPMYRDGERDQPCIFVHRTERGIESIEFVCSCGQRSKILIEYE